MNRSFEAAGNVSNCALVVAELRKKGRLPGYDKGAADVFNLLTGMLDTALVNAKMLAKFHTNSETDNPSTQVHELVEYLQSLQRA